MKRKLFLGLAALAALTITSCQKDLVINQIPEEQPIGFGTYVGRDAQTKANETTNSAMEVDTYPGFGVFAYYTGAFNWNATDLDSSTDDNQAPTPNFMYNQNVDYYGSIWDYSPVKYWPNSTDKISFFAYAPYTEVTPTPPTKNITAFSANNATGYPTVSFTVADNVADQVDLLYASALNQTKTNNSAEGVKFTFSHALSRIGFKAATANTNYKITVNEITISGNFTTAGTMTLEDGTITPTTQVSTAYTLSADANTTFIPTEISSTTALKITSQTTGEDYIMIIPTNLTSSKVTVTVEYSYQYKYDGTNFAQAETTTQTGSVGINFVKGNAYTLVMTLNPLVPITFDVTDVDAWDEDLDGYHTTNGDDDIPAIPTPGV